MVLINFFVPNAALIRGQRLIEGGAYSIKYGIPFVSEKLVSTFQSVKKKKLINQSLTVFFCESKVNASS